MIQELVKAFFFIFVAEMGDKTQIMAMAFATKYKVRKVLLGVLIGSFLNHGVAVVLGVYMSSIIPLELIRLIAACAFIVFGLWTLRSQGEDEQDEAKGKLGPVATVAMAFFIGELGDKTQLAAITLSTTAQYPAFILMGTVLGMVITSSFGIFVGSKLGQRIPELAIKMVSGFIFIFFGILGLFEAVPHQYITPSNVIAFFAILGMVIYLLIKPSIGAVKRGELSLFKRTAEELHEHVEKMKKTVDEICLGENYCGQCEGKKCMIGYLKQALQNVNEQGVHIYPEEWNNVIKTTDKEYSIDKAVEGLAVSIAVLKSFKKVQDKSFIANRAREIFELICFGQQVPFNGDVGKYFSLLRQKDRQLGEMISRKYDELQNI